MARLPNYLKTYRRRAGLSQDEVAFLLGCQSGAKVSRYERLARQPSLETALAYEAVLGIPVRELFAGVYEKVEGEINKRARLLTGNLSAIQTDRETERKLKALSMLTCRPEPEPQNNELSISRGNAGARD
jgi:transcriptional regulator with XRE-family HTH domain